MTIDDLLDYDVDALVERTKDRALPRGAISIQRAWAFFALQVFVGLYSAFFILKRPAYGFFLIIHAVTNPLGFKAVYICLCLATLHYISHMQGMLVF